MFWSGHIASVATRTGNVGDFRKLEVWKAGLSLVVSVYRCSSTFPRSEIYGLTSQMRRAGVSICANLAEGCGHRRDTELRRFARISLGSATELESHLLLARELGYLDPAVFESLGTDLYRVQAGLVQLIRSLSHPPDRASDLRPSTRDPRPMTRDPRPTTHDP